MKKFMITALTVFGMGVIAFAGDNVSAPSSKNSNPINADYGGISYAGSAFSNRVTTVALAGFTTNAISLDRYNIYGVEFSSGTCYDFVDVWVSSRGWITTDAPALRIYNVVGSSAATAPAGGICSGANERRWPLKLTGNVFFRPSSVNYNIINLLYWKEN